MQISVPSPAAVMRFIRIFSVILLMDAKQDDQTYTKLTLVKIPLNTLQCLTLLLQEINHRGRLYLYGSVLTANK